MLKTWLVGRICCRNKKSNISFRLPFKDFLLLLIMFRSNVIGQCDDATRASTIHLFDETCPTGWKVYTEVSFSVPVNPLHHVTDKSQTEMPLLLFLNNKKSFNKLLIRILTLVDQQKWISIHNDLLKRGLGNQQLPRCPLAQS